VEDLYRVWGRKAPEGPLVDPEKGQFFCYFTPYPALLPVTCLKTPYWSESFYPHSLSLVGSFPSAFLPQTIYKPSTSQLCHLSPESRDGMFLWNGVDLQNHIPKTQDNTNIAY
jgi:hypothetical protein